MLSATNLVYKTASSPPVREAVPADGSCWLCGSQLPGVGVPVDLFVRTSVAIFEYVQAIDSSFVCPACWYCFLEKCLELTALTGRERPQKMRTYSHFVKNGQWIPLTKSDKARMADLLLNGYFPELAVISDTQQKHTIYQSVPNPPEQHAGYVQFEDMGLYFAQNELLSLMNTINQLYGTFNKTEIETGSYSTHRIIKFGIDDWRSLEDALLPVRRGKLFSLAIWLAQREHIEKDEEEYAKPEGISQVSFWRGV